MRFQEKEGFLVFFPASFSSLKTAMLILEHLASRISGFLGGYPALFCAVLATFLAFKIFDRFVRSFIIHISTSPVFLSY